MYTGNNIQKIIFPLEILFVILMLKLGTKLKKKIWDISFYNNIGMLTFNKF